MMRMAVEEEDVWMTMGVLSTVMVCPGVTVALGPPVESAMMKPLPVDSLLITSWLGPAVMVALVGGNGEGPDCVGASDGGLGSTSGSDGRVD
jgi:hypothetical protein